MSELSQAAQNLNWLITNFVDRVPGVAHTVVVSSDGLLLAVSNGFPRDRPTSSPRSPPAVQPDHGRRADLRGRLGHPDRRRDGARLPLRDGDQRRLGAAVLASSDCDMGLIGYEMALLVERAGDVLTPALRAELQNSLPR